MSPRSTHGLFIQRIIILTFILVTQFSIKNNVLAGCDNNLITVPAMIPAAVQNSYFEIEVLLQGPGVQATDAIDWDVQTENPMSGEQPLAYLGLCFEVINYNTIKIYGFPKITGNYPLNVTASCSTLGDECLECAGSGDCTDCTIGIEGTYTVVINSPSFPRQAADVMLVLDRSGSMGQNVPGGSMNKWEVLKESVDAFLYSYRQWGRAGDRVGITYFSDERSDFAGGAGLNGFNTNAPPCPMPLSGPGSFKEDLNAKTVGGYTCMGGGILSAHSYFGAADQRNIILFTDGIQNREPMVDPATFIIDDYNIRPDGTGFTGYPLDLKNPGAKPFKLFTIAVGSSMSQASELGNMAVASANSTYDGTSLHLPSTAGLTASLQTFFDQTFVQLLKGSSPNFVDIRKAYPRGDLSSSDTFTINPSANKLLFKIIADPKLMRGAEIVVKKGSVGFSNLVVKRGLSYSTFYLDSALAAGYGSQLSGDWEVEISGVSGEFQINCLVDDELLHVDASIGAGEIEPGDLMSLELRLQYKGSPVDDADLVQATVLKPGQDLNDLFAGAGSVDPIGNFPTEKGNDPGQLKYEALIAFDTAFANALLPERNTIPLSHAGNGIYTGSFSDTEYSGVYRVIFTVDGTHPEAGRYHRLVMESAVIDFGLPEPADKSNFGFLIQDNQSYLKLSPINKFGHLIGPNRLNQIKLAVDGKHVSLRDHLDGTYQAQVPSFSFWNPNPKVNVSIKSHEFFNDRFSEIPGVDMNAWDKYKPWIILVLIIIAIIIALYKRLNP